MLYALEYNLDREYRLEEKDENEKVHRDIYNNYLPGHIVTLLLPKHPKLIVDMQASFHIPFPDQ